MKITSFRFVVVLGLSALILSLVASFPVRTAAQGSIPLYKIILQHLEANELSVQLSGELATVGDGSNTLWSIGDGVTPGGLQARLFPTLESVAFASAPTNDMRNSAGAAPVLNFLGGIMFLASDGSFYQIYAVTDEGIQIDGAVNVRDEPLLVNFNPVWVNEVGSLPTPVNRILNGGNSGSGSVSSNNDGFGAVDITITFPASITVSNNGSLTISLGGTNWAFSASHNP